MLKVPVPKLDSRKRKQIENKFTNDDLVQPSALQSNVVSFLVASSSSDKQYIVTLKNSSDGVHFECNCGDQWGINPRRNNCKHVGGVVGTIMKSFVKTHMNVKQRRTSSTTSAKHEVDIEEMPMDDIIDQFKKYMNID